MTKAIEERERVIVRFAGDSGDGMQLAGQPVHRRDRGGRQRPRDAAELPGRDPGSRRHAGRRVGVPDPLRLARHPHARRRAERARRDEPGGAARRTSPELERGATIIVNEDAFSQAQPGEGRATTPTRSRTARCSEYRVHRIPMTSLTTARGRGGRGRLDARRRPGQEPVRARRAVVAVRSAGRRRRSTGSSRSSRASPRVAAGEPGRVQRRLVVRRDDRAARRPVPRQPRHRRRARDVPQRQRHDRAVARADRRERPQRAAAGARPAIRSRPPPSCCTSSPATRASACSTIQAEDEIAAAGMALGAAFGGRLGVTATSGPGMDLKAETIGLAVMLELPMIDRRRAARRARRPGCRRRPSSPIC